VSSSSFKGSSQHEAAAFCAQGGVGVDASAMLILGAAIKALIFIERHDQFSFCAASSPPVPQRIVGNWAEGSI